jgi:hypothetical protein
MVPIIHLPQKMHKAKPLREQCVVVDPYSLRDAQLDFDKQKR